MVLLGAMLLESGNCELTIVRAFPELFYKDAHQKIFEAIKELYEGNYPIDILTVSNQLRKNNNLEIAGGPYYISMITGNVISSANHEYHFFILAQFWIEREQIRIGAELMKNSFDNSKDALETYANAKTELENIISKIAITGNQKSMEENFVESMKAAKHREDNAKRGVISGVPTGLKDLSDITNGWQPQDLIIIAARPGMGKSSLALFFAKKAAQNKIPACFFSLEMSRQKITDKLILSETNIDVNKYNSGYIPQESWQELEVKKVKISSLPIFIDDTASLTISQIKAICKSKKQKGQCGLIVIDYIQLIGNEATDKKNYNRENEVQKISRGSKMLAKELNVPVIMLCQLSREVEKRGGTKRPLLSDLRESGSIEQDADLVGFIYRPEYYGISEDETGNSNVNSGEFIIAKHRNGALGTVKFGCNKELTKFYDYDAENQPQKMQPLFTNREPSFNSSAISKNKPDDDSPF